MTSAIQVVVEATTDLMPDAYISASVERPGAAAVLIQDERRELVAIVERIGTQWTVPTILDPRAVPILRTEGEVGPGDITRVSLHRSGIRPSGWCAIRAVVADGIAHVEASTDSDSHAVAVDADGSVLVLVRAERNEMVRLTTTTADARDLMLVPSFLGATARD